MGQDAKPSEKPKTDPPAGVLGNLPRSRPAVRSPRRRAAAETRPDPAAPRAEAPSGAGEAPDEHGGSDLEALARGGIAVAGGAASLGLRIAGRAAAAVRDAVERR